MSYPGRKLATLLLILGTSIPANIPALCQMDLAQTAYQLTVDGSNLIRAGNPTIALDRLQRAFQLTPNSWDVNYFIGSAYEKQNHFNEARSWYERAYQINPARHEALLGIARTFYSQKDYADALPLMEKLTLNHPATESTYAGYLALAKCYAEVGRADDFESTMKKALSVKSSDPSAWIFAAQEMDYVGQTDRALKYYEEYIKRFPDVPDVKQVGDRIYQLTYKKDSLERLKEVNEGFTLHSDTDDLKEFVHVVDPKGKGISQTAMAQLMLGLSEIPRTYRHQLQAGGYKVIVTPDLLDAMPELSAQSPRGYGDGANWHSTAGVTDRVGKRILVAEKTMSNTGQVTTPPMDKTVQHEFGHAYDFFVGAQHTPPTSTNPFPALSHSEKFSKAYDKDAANVPANLRDKLAYYLQPGDAGKEELFAQMFVLFFGPRPEPGSPRESFQTAFPTVITTLHEARRSDPDFDRLQAIYEARFQDNILTPDERVKKILGQ